MAIDKAQAWAWWAIDKARTRAATERAVDKAQVQEPQEPGVLATAPTSRRADPWADSATEVQRVLSGVHLVSRKYCSDQAVETKCQTNQLVVRESGAKEV